MWKYISYTNTKRIKRRNTIWKNSTIIMCVCLTNEKVVNITNLDAFIENLLKIKDEELLCSINRIITSYTGLDVLFDLKEESQFYLLNELVLNKQLYIFLRNDTKENTLKIIKEGINNFSYKLLYMILSSDFDNNLKRTFLLWLQEGVCSLEEIKTKLNWLSKYEEYKDELLNKFYVLEDEYDKFMLVKDLETLGLDNEVDKVVQKLKLMR